MLRPLLVLPPLTGGRAEDVVIRLPKRDSAPGMEARLPTALNSAVRASSPCFFRLMVFIGRNRSKNVVVLQHNVTTSSKNFKTLNKSAIACFFHFTIPA